MNIDMVIEAFFRKFEFYPNDVISFSLKIFLPEIDVACANDEWTVTQFVHVEKF